MLKLLKISNQQSSWFAETQSFHKTLYCPAKPSRREYTRRCFSNYQHLVGRFVSAHNTGVSNFQRTRHYLSLPDWDFQKQLV